MCVAIADGTDELLQEKHNMSVPLLQHSPYRKDFSSSNQRQHIVSVSLLQYSATKKAWLRDPVGVSGTA